MELLRELAEPLLSPTSRTFWPCLLVAAVIAVGIAGRSSLSRVAAVVWHPSSRLDVQLLLGNQLLRVVGAIPTVLAAAGVAYAVGSTLLGLAPSPELASVLPSWVVVGAYAAVFFVAWDLSRFLVHLALHRVPFLWAFHEVHHSAEVLTPLTVHRVHPVESFLFRARGALVTGVLAGLSFWLLGGQAPAASMVAVTGIGWVLNAVFGNLRHSHVWLRFGALERWLISPAQHQLHHATHPRYHDCNLGVWLAVWDRMAGTWIPATEQIPTSYGLGAANHRGTLLSAWLAPFAAAFRTLLPRRIWLALGLAGSAAAQDADDAVVVVRDGTSLPEMSGSATVLDEDDLERFEHDDIHAVLNEATGVYTRTEDGFGLRPNIGIRGAPSERSSKVTLLEDGIPLVPAPYAAPAAYYFPMATRMTRVEVFKGPATLRYGPQTVGGAVNLVTRAVPDGAEGGLDLAIGERNTGRVHAFFGTGNDDRGLLLEVSHLATDGFKVLDGGGPTGFDRTDAMLKLRQRLVSGEATHELELKLGVARERSDETYLGLTPEDAEADPWRRYAASRLDRMHWFRTQAELSWHANLSPRVDVRTVAYHHYLDRDWFKLNRFADGSSLHEVVTGNGGGRDAVFLAVLRGEQDSISPGEALYIGSNDRQYESVGVQSSVRARLGDAEDPIEVEAGMRLHHDAVTRLHTEDEHVMIAGTPVATGSPQIVNTDHVSYASALSAFGHAEVPLGAFTVEPVLRGELIHTTRNGDAQVRAILLPGLGGWLHAGDALQVFAGVHRGFSPVAPGQGAAVRPETSWNEEIGVRLDAGLQGELTAFASQYDNLIGDCTFAAGCDDDVVGDQFNGGQVGVIGVEASVSDDVPLSNGLSLPVRVGYTGTHARFRSSFDSTFPQFGRVEAGDLLPYVPAHQVSGRVGVRSARFGVDVGVTGRSGMADAATEALDPRSDVPPLVLVDAAAFANLDGHVKLYVTGTNLADNGATVSLRPYGARPSNRRLVMVGVELH